MKNWQHILRHWRHALVKLAVPGNAAFSSDSTAYFGVNTAADRLNENHFMITLVAALVLHVLAFIGWNIWPKEAVDIVPVHVLHLKLGSGEGSPDVIGMSGAAEASAAMPATRLSAALSSTPEKRTTQDEATQSTAKTSAVAPTPPPKAHAAIPANASPDSMAVSGTSAPNAANSTRPKQFVREGNGTNQDGMGAPFGDSTAEDAVVMKRYEQLLSQWIERHKTYPESARKAGIQGRATLRIRINREGKILFYTLEKATGSDELDRAVAAMVQQANPVPPVPKNYPAGRVLEFLVPVDFRLR